MTRKTYFQERTAAEIRHISSPAYSARNLVRRILDLSPNEGLELRFPLIPGEFRAHAADSAEASRKCYKHGEYISLSQPKTQGAALECKEIPLETRARDLSQLQGIREDSINVLGYSFRPVQGNDRRKRIVNFAWIMEAARLFAYAENNCGSIETTPYDHARKVSTEGAEVICKVPSRSKKKTRYTIRLSHVPMQMNGFGIAIAHSLVSDFDKSPEHSTYNMKYNWERDAEGSSVFTFYPHDIAAYFATIRKNLAEHKLAPLTFSPIALPSKLEAEFYSKLGSNVLIYDPTLQAKDKTRKLHIAEKSILIARSIGRLGHDATMFWNPQRDGRLKDYSW